MGDLNNMQKYAIAIGGLAVVVVLTIAILNGFARTTLIPNVTVQLFVTGLVIFGTFTAVIVLALVGKIVIGLMTKK